MTFLIRPRFRPGESISSWRQRGGLSNGFRWFPTPDRRWSVRDPDALPQDLEAEWLAQEFDVSRGDLWGASLNRYASRLADGAPVSPLARWILPCARQSSRIGATSGYCPVCLRNDDIPYFRLSWRLAFVTHCPVHECWLISRCPTCASCVWPSAFVERAGSSPKVMDLSCCTVCGTRLARAEAVVDGKAQASIALWNALVSDTPPRGAPQGISLQDYFAVLWSVSRVVRRNLERFLRSFPASCDHEADLRERRNVVLERLSISSRQTIVSMAAWLLDEWPARLIETCERAGISGNDFACTQVHIPKWFDDVVHERLFQCTNWITREHVQTAISELKTKELPVSKNALRRTLGITESWAINELLDQRRSASVEELVTLCKHYYATLEHTPPSRDQQRTLTRDFLMLLFSAFSGATIEAVCRMTEEDVGGTLAVSQLMASSSTSTDMRFLADCLLELDDQYRHGIRPDFMFRGKEIPKTWFVSRFGKMMDGHSVRTHITALMQGSLDPKLWCSADTFLNTLARGGVRPHLQSLRIVLPTVARS